MQNTLTKERALLYSLLRSALNGEELPPGVSLRELIILRFGAYRRVKYIITRNIFPTNVIFPQETLFI